MSAFAFSAIICRNHGSTISRRTESFQHLEIAARALAEHRQAERRLAVLPAHVRRGERAAALLLELGETGLEAPHRLLLAEAVRYSRRRAGETSRTSFQGNDQARQTTPYGGELGAGTAEEPRPRLPMCFPIPIRGVLQPEGRNVADARTRCSPVRGCCRCRSRTPAPGISAINGLSPAPRCGLPWRQPNSGRVFQLARRLRASPPGVRGPVLRPPYMRQRPFFIAGEAQELPSRRLRPASRSRMCLGRDGPASRVHGVHRTFPICGPPHLATPTPGAHGADDTPRSGPAAASILVKAASVSIGCTCESGVQGCPPPRLGHRRGPQRAARSRLAGLPSAAVEG